ncbi:hypothetical protein M0802_004811 [Mischocyttarus mexicanus]|nr:hypothetical protein M0802_004811 [Mischocyttarus mexicanus]
MVTVRDEELTEGGMRGKGARIRFRIRRRTNAYAFIRLASRPELTICAPWYEKVDVDVDVDGDGDGDWKEGGVDGGGIKIGDDSCDGARRKIPSHYEAMHGG